MKEGNNNEKEHHLRNTSRRSVTCDCVRALRTGICFGFSAE